MKYVFPYIMFVFSILTASITNPQYDDILNYTEVLLSWEQIEDAKAYKFEIFNDSNQLIHTATDSSLNIILSNIFDWESTYYINMIALTSNSNEILIESNFKFHTDELPEIQILPFTTNTIIDNQYYPGYNFIDDVVINKNGEAVLFMPSNGLNRFGFMNQLDNGNFLGIGYGTIGGFIIDIDGNFQYITNPESGDIHHDFQPMGNGNFLGLIRESISADIPDGAWDNQLQQNGINSLIWQYDDIVEFDELGNEVWRWSSNDYFSKNDFNPNWLNVENAIQNSNNNGLTPRFDWTHCNAIFYDPSENTIYLSCRHLSRIVKISYPSGDVIWMVGEDMPSGDVQLGNDIQISSQHAIKLLDNGNLMLFDNGNFKDPELSRCIEFQISNYNNQLAYNLVWEYILPEEYYSSKLSDCDRLPNGNSLITSGAVGYSLEVDQSSNQIWDIRSNYYDHSGEGIGNYTSYYRSERIDGLYPLVYSVTVDNFKDSLNNKYIYIPTGNSYFNFTIFNEGYDIYNYDYNVTDTFGLINFSGQIEILENDKIEFSVPINVPLGMSNNLININVSPVSIYPTSNKIINLIANDCNTNPNYIYTDMGECLPLNEEDCLVDPADVTGDGNIDILDLVQIVNLILEIFIPEYECAADYNADGQINILDIVGISNYILNP